MAAAVWFETWFGKIRLVNVVAETDKTITTEVDGRRRVKRSEYLCYFPTFDEAKQFLIEQAEEKVKGIRIQLDRANGELGNAKGIKDPTLIAARETK